MYIASAGVDSLPPQLQRHDCAHTEGDTSHDPPTPPSLSLVSFSALLHAATTATPLPLAPASAFVQSPQHPTLLQEGTPSRRASNSLVLRRQRNRLSCRKTRLKRKLERAGMAILAYRRQERQQWLLDLLDELHTPLSASPRSVCADLKTARCFITRNLHYALVDAEYAATARSQAAPATNLDRRWWPARAVIASMTTQWTRAVDDLINAELTILGVTEPTDEDDGEESSIVTVTCSWEATGVVQALLARCCVETARIRGRTKLQFAGTNAQMVEVVAESSTRTSCGGSVDDGDREEGEEDDDRVDDSIEFVCV